MNPSVSNTVNKTAKETIPVGSLPSSPRIPSNITIRAARESDLEALAVCFFTSFRNSNLFWYHEFTPEKFYHWWIEAWRIGLVDDPSMVTFLAVDTAVKPDTSAEKQALPPWDQKGANVSDGRVVAFTRWRVPQEDGNNDEKWPDLPEGLDMDVMGAFFGGMETNHHELMEKRPHWFLQMLGTDMEYQKKGIGRCFVEWGCELADEQGLECYVDASEIGASLYKSAGFVWKKRIEIPDKESTYGHVNYETYVRPKKQ